MIDFEIAEIEAANQFARLLNPRVDFTTPYIFYYDETNNIKTFYVKENDFNYTFTANFVWADFYIREQCQMYNL